MASHSDDTLGDATGAGDVSPDTVDAGAPAHTTYVAARDIPSDIVVGERFRMKVGIKCSNGCRLANSELAIYDHEGKQVAVGALPDEHWPGTIGMYGSEVELEAPASQGLYTWRVKRLPTSAGIPHAEGSLDVGIRVVADEHGVARIRVAKGAYQLFVSQTNYLTFGQPIEVAADMTARAELDLEPVLERN